MQRLLSRWRLLCIAIPALVLAAVPVATLAGEVPKPEVPQARAKYSETQGCVEPTQEMRKNHMNYILHQRDRTMHEGIRTRQYSLEECINCHVTPGAAGALPTADSHEHFCNSCHAYAAVHIDCFQCHADRPTRKSQIPDVDRRSAMQHKAAATVSPSNTATSQTLDVLAAEGPIR
jgi:hypothetical protein